MEIKIFDEPLEKFIQSLEKPIIAKVLRIIDLLEEFGYKLTMPHSKKITERLFELRIRGKQEVRIFYTFHKNTIVLLCGYIKKTPKAPGKEISQAQKRLKLLT